VAAILAGLSLAPLVVRPNWSRHPVTGCRRLVDPGDRGGAVLLAVAALYAFIASRLVLYEVLVLFDGESGHAFQCGQSVLINGFALLLMGLAVACAGAELAFLALVCALAGAAKVFGHDLWFTSGVPLVLSVSSSAVTAAVGSLLWTQWQRRNAKPDPNPGESASA
jgi:hypothetical protein